MSKKTSYSLYYFQQDTTKRDTTKKVPVTKPTDTVKPPVNPLGGASPATAPTAVPATPAATAPAATPGASAGQKTITGTVVDEKKLGLPGVGIKIQGKTGGTVTQENGKFSISVSAPTDVLVFSYIGYQSKSMPAGNGATPLVVSLVPSDSQNLNDVVVVGYGTLKTKEVTSSVAHVDTAQFRQGGARNALDLIQGKVAGLNLTRTSGSNPNSGPSVQLRGAITVTGDASPLYVIDGIPGGNIDLLQQDDILSVDVLKDGSGAAIYGTSANAGVILITTKKGKPGAPTFNYSAYIRKEYIQNRQDFLTADEFRAGIQSGQIDAVDYGGSEDLYGSLINKNNFSQNHNVSLSGGTSNTNYRASLNYRDLQGIGLENGRKEYTFRLNVNQRGLNDKLNVQMNLATNFNNANLLGGSGWEEELVKNPTKLIYNPDGSFYHDTQSTNQYARLFQERNYRKQQTTSADIKADYDLAKGLKASIFGSVQRNSYIDGAWASIFSERSIEDSDYPNGGFASKGNYLSQNFAVEPTVSYNTTINDKHSITAVAGYSYRYNIEEGQSADNRGFLNDQFHEDNLSQGLARSDGRANLSSFKSDNTLIAFFGRVNYAFNNKYLLQLILRHEGSSKFGVNNKWGDFPAVSVGWNISDENFMKNVKWVNYLKLRAGYGVTGNTGFTNNASRVLLGGGGRYLYPDGTYRETYGPTTNVNPNLKWETKRELNIGADFTLFNSKLTGALDVFDRTTKDLLDTYTTPQPPYVLANIYANVGTISSKGVELALSYKAIQKKDFSFTMDFTGSTLSNKFVSYSDDVFKVKYKTFGGIGGSGDLGDAITTYEGSNVGEFWGKRFAGFTEDGKWLFFNRNGEAVTNDKINYSKDPNLTDLAKIGNAIPKYYASYTANFGYKNWDLRVFVRGKFDYQILNTTALTYANPFVKGSNYLRSAFNDPKFSQINDTFMYSDYYLEEGTNVKIDEVTLGYNFKFKSKTIRNLRVYATGQNLFTITGYSGNDPDFIADTGLGPGVDNRNAYPSTRSFLFGVNVGF
ncbi:SusC/RagA family TonB-linked outer membrane protein [Pedobacter endophyticus]|uniref:SusC/RagA family TonB-linked outer membrane protein n=1 Tax=Pedobacter endophyticus TaxID=2789740 RepID=A0A7S9Q0F8_9SPHI|nr:SusC/RagA family TonB-linked outer membrane protein [Pedobacter endophyticus]QPH41348.1 SusC/RagA family TonB-linked outer membrane protein [Pedobacter endophyticus]